MSQAVRHTTYSTPTRNPPESSPGEGHPAQVRGLSDREAVIAVMVANGATCEDVADRLSLPARAVEAYLRQALQLLEVTGAEDLTFVVVAAHYDRDPTATSTHP